MEFAEPPASPRPAGRRYSAEATELARVLFHKQWLRLSVSTTVVRGSRGAHGPQIVW
jgi:hypothetical protein